ncbi:membrane dipeptidase [Leptolyngbya sp. Heron Island J]|uniref:dipeptidase n=1 Tax=Leptolyngbya sp. Heron Island J TaxID=1385935 RepID=UPI0003B9464B|nr:dipeptidase [Leptolyngbya sp. Heron Island J]ESA35559.1 membrane dipeptidase [Leptolyngbya sp. Heron Island J]
MLGYFLRRRLTFIIALVAALGWVFAQTNISPTLANNRAAVIHQAVLTIDSHIDWPIRQSVNPEFDPGMGHETGAPGSGQWDLVRMAAGGLDGAFISIFTPQRALTDEGYAQAATLAHQMIDWTEQLTVDYPDRVAIALTPEDAYGLEHQGKRAIFLGMENGYPLGTDIQAVQTFYNRGVRYITLTHSKNNQLGDSSTDDQQLWQGLSPFGETVIHEMNRLGMMVDISHVHDDTFWHVIGLTKAPVIASHSSARALRDVPRNMDDTMLRAIQENGGVVQLCLLGDYIKEIDQDPRREAALAALSEQQAAWLRGDLSEAEVAELLNQYRAINAQYPEIKPTLADAIDHLDHMVAVMGIDHVGIGSDFDGGGGLVNIEDVSQMPNITQELLDRGYTPDEIRKIWGGNLMRVFNQVIDVAKQLQAEAES